MSLDLLSRAADEPPPASARRDRPMFEMDDRYRRVGGWLLFFCLNLLFTPVAALLAVVGLFMLPDEIEMLPGVMRLLRIGVVQLCVLGALCLVAAVKLIRIRPDAVRFARLVLLLHPILAMAMLLMPMLVGVPEELRPGLFWDQGKYVLQNAAFAGVWFAYFAMSERVTRTFPVTEY
jgi:hypothetical protein